MPERYDRKFLENLEKSEEDNATQDLQEESPHRILLIDTQSLQGANETRTLRLTQETQRTQVLQDSKVSAFRIGLILYMCSAQRD